MEEAVTVLLLVLFLTHFHVPVLEPVQSSLFAASSDDQTSIGQWIAVAIWFIAGTLMLRHARLLFSALRGIAWTTSFAAIALLSAAWSQDAGITLRKAVFLILTTAFGIYIARRYSIQKQLQIICIAALFAALLSICFALLLPAYGTDHDAHEGVWVGIFTQKNVCAREMIFLLASVLVFKPVTQGMAACRYLTMAATLLVILKTGSKTALLIAGILMCVLAFCNLYRRASRSIVMLAVSGLFGTASIVCLIAASAMPGLLQMLGRDGTMTGRTDIWQAVFAAIMKRPLLGYGFSAFWLSLRGESANVILTLRWAVPAAHNGFLEVWLQLGAAGLIVFLSGFLSALRSAFRGLRQPSYSAAVWPLAILLLTLVYNLDESSLMQPNDFLWVIYVATLANLSPPALQRMAAALPNDRPRVLAA